MGMLNQLDWPKVKASDPVFTTNELENLDDSPGSQSGSLSGIRDLEMSKI